MAKVKVIKNQLNQNLNGEYFNDTPSNTIFSFGKFFITTNFDNKVTIDYTNTLSSFVNTITLETLNVSEKQSEIFNYYSTNAILNLDKSDLNTFVRYGSAYEFLRVSIQNIIVAYPGSLFANSQTILGGNYTYSGLTYNVVTNIATFYVPTAYTTNIFGIIINTGNETIPDDNKLKNLNESYDKYVIWSILEPNTLFPIVGYTGNTINSNDDLTRTHLKLQVEGNPFALVGTGNTANLDYHIRPNNVIFEEFRALLSSYEKHIISQRDETDGFKFVLKDPTLLEDGNIIYSDSQILWSTSDKYNIDINTPTYQQFLKIVLTIGSKYDKIKTDLIARFLTPMSLKTYDFTEEGKITKLLRIYGREFDQMRQFIDSLVHINKITYNKINNIPDQLIKNMANTFGWDYFSLVNENELIDGFLTIDDTERNLNDNILPAEIDVELWRRIINNTSYFWKSKGTRHAIKSMFLLIGIPEPFINITEYVYTVDGKIDPNTVPLTQADFPSNSLPYDTNGYPIAPLETSDFYFQFSGNSDSGQAYLDVFRNAGFNLSATVDNKKSWVQAGATTRIHNTTPQYHQEDSKLIINTKEIDIALDTARGIEYDVYKYIQKDFEANSSGYTLPYSYVNLSLAYTGEESTFTLPYNVNTIQGDFEVRYNGILLNAPSTGSTTGITEQSDYSVSGNSFTITNPAINLGNRRDVIQATIVTTGGTINNALSAVTVQYIVTRLQAVSGDIYIDLPSYPRGDLQLTINGIALTKGTSQFTADYILDPTNSSGGTNRIIIQNPDVITFLNSSPTVQVAYMKVDGSNNINLRSEVVRVDSFNSNKIYFNASANKYVYKLNYKATNTSDIKFLINGIALEPNLDYSINVMNPYEIFLPKGIKYGTVISVYYLVANSSAFAPVVSDSFGLGDISQLSFLEFIELIQRKMINARNRKIVTDFKGGWYPALLRIYEVYLKRASLSDNDPLQSNGYTFQNLYPFLSKYNAFFQRFVDQLLSATIIIKKGGLLIRNTVFTKQKHWYKRGVNVASGTTALDMRKNSMLQYFGDDGTTFKIIQSNILPPPPPPTILYVETIEGVLGSIITGGENIIGYDELGDYGKYGVDYKKSTETNWIRISVLNITTPLNVNHFTTILTGLDEDSDYQYRAFIESQSTGATGNTRTIHTPPPPPLTPEIETKTGHTAGYYDGTTYYGKIISSGGKDIVRYGDIQYYAIQYRISGNIPWIYEPSSPASGPLTVDNFTIPEINNLVADTTYEYRAYMYVDATAYYGDIEEITTPVEPESNPEVTTGNADSVTVDSFAVNDNEITNKGVPTPITKYGILWTINSSCGTDANLLWSSPLASGIYEDSTVGDISTGVTWNKNATGLPTETTTYYRAFGINSCVVDNIGYGDVKEEQTLPAPYVPVHVYMTMGFTCIPYTTPNQRFTASLSGVVGEDVCIEDLHADGFDAGGGAVASATATGSVNVIEYPASTAGSCWTKTNETCDAAWDNATQYAYLSPSFVVNGTTINTPSPNAGSCITLSNNDIIEFCFSISCTPL